MTGAQPREPRRDPDIHQIRADIERTGGQLDDTVDTLSAKPHATAHVDDRSAGAAKPALTVVASVAGATVVAVFWWRRHSGRRRR
jgi:hypothetical protein